MTEQLTDEQKQQIIDEYLKNQAASTEQKEKEAAEQAERDKKGRFKPKPSAENSPAATPTPENSENTKSSDQLLDTLEEDFKKGLKDHPILKELVGLDQRTRIRMLRAVANTVAEKPRGEGVDPSGTPPPIMNEPKTLSELNNLKDYLHDVQQTHSMLNITQKIRGKP